MARAPCEDSMLSFDGVQNYDGEVSYRQDATIWRPLIKWMSVWHHARNLRFEPKRNSIGIWFNHCRSPLRTPIFAALLASGLKVESYGDCRRNRPSAGSILAGDSTAIHACHKHRLMLAVQHTACRDYINDNVDLALQCGAVPIIARINGKPDYAQFLGSFPHVDASRPGWLSLVRRIMTDDATYARVLETGGTKASPPPLVRQHEVDGGYHCQFHNAHRHLQPHTPNASWSVVGATTSSKRVVWERCLACEGTQEQSANKAALMTVRCPAHTQEAAMAP